MGTRRGYSVTVGPVPYTYTSWIITVTIIVLASLPFTESYCEPGDTSCCSERLQQCSDLYENAQEGLGVRDDYLRRGYTPSPADTRVRCIALRTFHKCLKNITRPMCRGNLNYHSADRGVEKQMKLISCKSDGPTYNRSRNTQPNAGPIYDLVCSYPGSDTATHKHCGLFGDPHLRTFNNEFQTCRVEGAWPLIDNKYLTVQVTNDPVGRWEGTATATSKLTVMLKSHEDCASHHFITYQAQTDYLPSVFDDGRSHLGQARSVLIKEIEANRHVEIYLRYIDTTIILRQIGRYLTFAIKMPEDVINESLADDPETIQLCAKGCPQSEQINYEEFLAQKRVRLKSAEDGNLAMSRDEAVVQCRQSHVVDFYFDSCVFDLMTTGDSNFTLAAYAALQDVLHLYPQAQVMQKNRTTLDDIDRKYASHASSATIQRTSSTNLHYLHRTTYVLLGFIVFLLCRQNDFCLSCSRHTL